MSEYLVMRGGTSRDLDLTRLDIGGRDVLCARCECEGRYHRLGSKRAVYCPECGVLMARVGERITTMRFSA